MKFKVGDIVTYIKHIEDYDSKYFVLGKKYKVVSVVSLPDVLHVENNIIDDAGYEDQVYVGQVTKCVPNNKLSKLVYPKYIESDCGEYLVPRSLDEV